MDDMRYFVATVIKEPEERFMAIAVQRGLIENPESNRQKENKEGV
jgi:hypothetical protein